MDQIPAGNGQGLDWTIARLEISRGTVMLDNLVEDTSIPIRLGVRHPIVDQRPAAWARPTRAPRWTVERVTEIVNVAIVSPVDPVSPVFFFPLTRLHYTYSEIWHHHIHEVEMIRPTIYPGRGPLLADEGNPRRAQRTDG